MALLFTGAKKFEHLKIERGEGIWKKEKFLTEWYPRG
jgi:hypothetical protein